MHTTRTANFNRSLATSLGKGALLFAAILAFVIPASVGGAFDVGRLATDDEVMAIRPSLPNSPEALVERHGCWTGEAPGGVTVPGHVVVSEVGEAPRYAGAAMVRKALEQAFDGVDHGLRVHGYCL